MNNKFNIILLPGDGIGQEISKEAKKFLIGSILKRGLILKSLRI